MENKDLQGRNTIATLLTTANGLSRLLSIMRSWWDGWPLAAMGIEHGISRQRVHRILARVGCNRRLWYRARRGRADSARRASDQRVAEAFEMLTSPLATGLTARQRCALCWQAMGLVSPEIGKRMAIRPQNARRILLAAHWRMDRLIARAAVQDAKPISASDLDGCDLSDLIGEPVQPVSTVAATDTPVVTSPSQPPQTPDLPAENTAAPQTQEQPLEHDNTDMSGPNTAFAATEVTAQEVNDQPVDEPEQTPQPAEPPKERLRLSDLQRQRRSF